MAIETYTYILEQQPDFPTTQRSMARSYLYIAQRAATRLQEKEDQELEEKRQKEEQAAVFTRTHTHTRKCVGVLACMLVRPHVQRQTLIQMHA